MNYNNKQNYNFVKVAIASFFVFLSFYSSLLIMISDWFIVSSLLFCYISSSLFCNIYRKNKDKK